MSFQQAKRAVIEALQQGHVHYEPRTLRKNLLADGTVSFREAIAIMERTRGGQAHASPHHAQSHCTVWVFRPDDWYIKFYLLEGACFLSFHRQEA